MPIPLSVNEVIDRATELDGETVEVIGQLVVIDPRLIGCLDHHPAEESRDAPGSSERCRSSLSLDLIGAGAVAATIASLDRQVAILTGTVRAPSPGEPGCGVFGLFAAEIEPLSVSPPACPEGGAR